MERPPSSGVLALIAGAGLLPEAVARGAASAGIPLVVYTPGSFRKREMLPSVEGVDLLSLPGAEGKLNLGALLADMKRREIAAVTLAGLVQKENIYGPLGGAAFARILASGSNDDHALLGRIVAAFEAAGFPVISCASFLSDSLASEGHLAGPPISDRDRDDVLYGRRILSVTLPLSFGQACGRLRPAVVAVEAMEGTDRMIRRCAPRRGCGGAVVKMMRPDQDDQFRHARRGAGHPDGHGGQQADRPRP
ncbi:UDP-2,3-diacylglucosamine diphosphatase LpxI [Aminivibrio sp.]